jgi:phage gpG-like protein
MGWDGDLAPMGQLVENLGKLARVPAQAARPVSDRLEAMIQEQFDLGVDPYGKEWADLAEATKEKGREWPPLTDKGDMRRSAHVAPMSGTGVAIAIDHPAQVHQTGGHDPKRGWSMPARPVLPGGSFPASWRDAIDDIVADEIGKMGLVGA